MGYTFRLKDQKLSLSEIIIKNKDYNVNNIKSMFMSIYVGEISTSHFS
jgi:hypothetical protein